jgi:uncharacterized membrane protein
MLLLRFLCEFSAAHEAAVLCHRSARSTGISSAPHTCNSLQTLSTASKQNMKISRFDIAFCCVLALYRLNIAEAFTVPCCSIAATSKLYSFSISPPTKFFSVGSATLRHGCVKSTNHFAPLFQHLSTSQRRSLLKTVRNITGGTHHHHVRSLTASLRFPTWDGLKPIFQRLLRWSHRSIAAIALFITVFFSVLPPAMAAGSSGRMGGSFGSSGGRSGGHGTTKVFSSSPGRTSRSQYYNSSPWSRSAGRPYIRVPIRYGYHHHHHQIGPATRPDATTTITNPDGTTTIVRRESRNTDKLRFSASDVILVTGAASCVAYGITKHYQDREDGDAGPDTPLGKGFAVFSLTACLNVPNRNDPDSILQRLSQLAQTSDTSNRKGLQTLMADTSLELARQEKAIVSIESHYDHTMSPIQAERQYNRQSAQQRSKFDRESLSNYDGKRSQGRNPGSSSTSETSSATVALVNIHLAIEGNSLRAFDGIKTRKSLKEVLSQISSDVQVEDCLLAGEVIWSPEDSLEQMTMEDIYSDFPTLYTLLD